jgi:hypothetical protein
MTPLQNYSALIDSIFGAGTTKFDTTKTYTHNVIGAFNHPTEFNDFKNNFISRLHRLQAIYSSQPTYLKEIITLVNEIASEKNWEGAFAELAAFDHFNQDILNDRTYLHTPIKPNQTIDKSRTFALEFGKAAANLDAFVEDRPLYLDFKVFKDNVNEIFQKLYSDLERHFNRNDFIVSAEYDLALSVDDVAPQIGALRNELQNGIVPGDKTTYLKSSVIPNLGFRILWGSGVLSAERTNSPYRQAENFFQMIFKNADQFVKDKPSILVYVVFPWYNGIVTNFADSNTQLYRSFARRVFCLYKHDNNPFKNFYPKFTGSQTIYEVSNNISGIIFLEDNTVLSKVNNVSNTKSFVYLNPNAKNSLNRSLAHDFLLGLHNAEFDNFEHDNY